MHTNVSTQKMRDEGGIEHIKKAIYKLGARHKEHIAVYGEDNDKRLSGKYETANINQFSYGVANRGASIRIGRDTEKEGKGYFEVSALYDMCIRYIVVLILYREALTIPFTLLYYRIVGKCALASILCSHLILASHHISMLSLSVQRRMLTRI